MRLRTGLAPAWGLAFALLAGCGQEEPPAPARTPEAGPVATAPANSAPAAGKLTAVDLAGGASIAGKVVFSGTAPAHKKIDMSAEGYCETCNPQGAFPEDVVVNGNGTLRNALVYVSEGLEGKRFAPPAEPVVLDQKSCLYHPHVLAVRVGQKLSIRNSDSIAHNIHALPRANNEFNFGQSRQGQENEVVFQAPELMIRVKCDVHPWMGAWIGVFDHPFFAVTGEDGRFAIRGLPPGEYEVTAWHEKLKGAAPMKVRAEAKNTAEITFTFPP